jgi:hypothetical protein
MNHLVKAIGAVLFFAVALLLGEVALVVGYSGSVRDLEPFWSICCVVFHYRHLCGRIATACMRL